MSVSGSRRRLALAVVVLSVGAACGSGDGGSGASGTTTDATPPASTGPGPSTTVAGPRSAPRWETVHTFSGTGPTQTDGFTIMAQAIQWRVRWRCEGSGAFVLTTTPAPTVRRGPIADAACPKEGEAFAIHTGPLRLGIETQGAWTAIVDQQIDIPLDEPLLPAMAATAPRASGAFYDLEKEGMGTARLYDLDGRLHLRFENFVVTENVDLFVWLTDAARPANSAEAVAANRVVLGNLKSTVGNQNYAIPASVTPAQARSVVIWCEPVAVAYAAAPLGG